MVSLTSLWLPTLLSAVAVFVASSVIHLVLTYHQTDYRAVPDEDRVRDALGGFSIPPGDYSLPYAGSMEEMKYPEYLGKMQEGTVALMTVSENGPPQIGASLIQWFVSSLVIALFAGYVASRALEPGAHYLAVFRFVGCTAFVGYVAALWQGVIWFKRSWVSTAKSSLDGLIYALLTAGVFGWLWPQM